MLTLLLLKATEANANIKYIITVINNQFLLIFAKKIVQKCYRRNGGLRTTIFSENALQMHGICHPFVPQAFFPTIIFFDNPFF